MKKDSDVIFSVMRLSRALRRCPPEGEERPPFPPAVGRLMICVKDHPGVSSRDLCELLDLRPSTMSEMLARAEEAGWIIRKADEADKRVQHATLTEQGEKLIEGMETAREADAAKKTACFTEAEKKEFSELCDKLADHLDQLAADRPAPEGPPHRGPHHGPHHPPMHGEGFPPEGMPPRPPRKEREEEHQEEESKWKFPSNTRFRC